MALVVVDIVLYVRSFLTDYFALWQPASKAEEVQS